MAPITHVDEKTRNNLAYLWSIAIIIMIFYIIIMFGEAKEILTLIIGFITGAASTILCLYFGGVLNNKNTIPPPAGTADINISASTTKE